MNIKASLIFCTVTIAMMFFVSLPVNSFPSGLGQRQKVDISDLPPETLKEIARAYKRLYNLTYLPDKATLSQIQVQGVTKPGESAKGYILTEKSRELYLDATPCEMQWDKKQIFTFNNLYDKREAGKKNCGDSSADIIPITEVTQR